MGKCSKGVIGMTLEEFKNKHPEAKVRTYDDLQEKVCEVRIGDRRYTLRIPLLWERDDEQLIQRGLLMWGIE